MGALQILHRDPGSNARAGILRTAHGEVRTPAFVPLATKGVVKGLEPREVAALGYDMVLGNTFHLFLDPGPELVARLRRAARVHALAAPIITDSGGFQVFSMGHGTVADEIKGRAPSGANRLGRVLSIEEEGVRFRSYVDGSERFLGPETSMEVQAALGSDLALVFDECTPFNIDRDYTARSTERTHRWLDRCLAWHDEHGPQGQLVYGIVQGGVHEDLRIASAQEIAARPVDGIAIGGSLGADKPQMYEVVGWAISAFAATRARATCSASATSTTSSAASSSASTRSTARCRRAWAATASRSSPSPRRAGASTSPAARWKHSQRADHGGLPVPVVRGGLHARLPALPPQAARAHGASAC